MARAALTVAWMALLLHAGSRWHSGAVMAPLQVDPAGGPAIVIVTQEGDCPERLAALHRWLDRALDPGAPGKEIVRLRLAGLGGVQWEGSSSSMRRAEALEPRDARNAGRAFSRFATDGTPGVLVVGEGGYALAGFGFTPAGPDEAWNALAGLARPLGLSGDAPTPQPPPDLPEDGAWNR